MRLFFLLFLLLPVLSCAPFRKNVFPGNPDLRLPKVSSGVLLETLSQNRTAYSFYIPGTNVPVIYFHGNGGTISHSAPLLDFLLSNGNEILMVEYPGYGRASKFESSENALYADAEASISRAVSDYGLSTNRAVLWGYSLGTGVAAEFAKRGYGSRMVLMAPYTSIPAVGERRTIPFIPHLLMPDRFDTLSKAPSISIPVLILHGESDPVVPYDMGVTLSKSFPRAGFISLPRAGHDMPNYLKKPAVAAAVREFLNGSSPR